MPPSSNASLTCRTDWRPSAWLVGALCALALLAAASAWASALPGAWRPAVALAALVYGGWLAWREARRRPACLAWDHRGACLQDGQGGWVPLREPRLQFRGPLVQLRAIGRGGRRVHLLWWPDTLPPPARRRLRLAASVSHRSDFPHASVAA